MDTQTQQTATPDEEKEKYQQLVIESCEYLLPILTKFETMDSAPHQTLYHLSLIVDASLKSVFITYRDGDFFKNKNKQFNLKQIESKLFPKNINAEQTSRLKNLFNQFVIYVTQQLNWKSSFELTDQLVLPKILPVIREKQMFNLGLEKHYRNIISSQLEKLHLISNQQLLGVLALSAIFDSHKLHLQFVEAIADSKIDNLIWLTDNDVVLELSGTKLHHHPTKLHFNTLAILLEKFRRDLLPYRPLDSDKKSIENAVAKLYRDYIQSQPKGVSDLTLPLRINQIIEIAGTDYFMHRPAFFHAAMTGNLQQTPLAIETKLRILSGFAVKRTKKTNPLQEESKTKRSNELVKKLSQHENWNDHEESQTSIHPLSWQLNSIKDLLTNIAGLSKQKVLNKLQQTIEQPNPNQSLISLWLIAWLKNLYAGADNHEVNRKAKKSLKKNSILRYFSTVYRHVLPVFDNIDVAELEEDEWIELLQECLDNSKDTQLFKPLSRFVRFLTANFDLPILPLQDLEGGLGFTNVNANLISPYEIEQILHELLATPSGTVSSTHRMQACALILGFFCGLRRKEVLGLRTTDIYGHQDRPFLFLRSHKDRTLKNAYSRRRLDLVDIVPQPYLKHLMDWHSHQSAVDMKFFMSFSDQQIGDDQTIIDPVQEYCRQITGDETFVFHGLRHSFANLYQIRIMQISHPNLQKWLGIAKRAQLTPSNTIQALDDFYSVNQAKIFLKKYFPTENQTLPRSTLLQLAELLGHKVPDTTSRSYLHLIDEIEAEYFTSVNESIKEALISQYWDFKKPYQRTRFKKTLLTSDNRICELSLIRQLYAKTLGKEPSSPLQEKMILQPGLHITSEEEKGSESNWPNPTLIANIYPIYKQLFVQKASSEDIANAFSLPRQDIEKIKTNALNISQIKTSKGKPRFKHPFLLRRSNDLEKKLNQLMKKIAKSDLNLPEIQPGLKMYLQRAQSKTAYRVMLKNTEEFVQYLKLLKAIQLSPSKIGIRIYPSECATKTKYELKKYWTRVFQESTNSKIPPLSIKILAPIATKAESGQVELEPIKLKDKEELLLLEEFQYAIYLISIFK